MAVVSGNEVVKAYVHLRATAKGDYRFLKVEDMRSKGDQLDIRTTVLKWLSAERFTEILWSDVD